MPSQPWRYWLQAARKSTTRPEVAPGEASDTEKIAFEAKYSGARIRERDYGFLEVEIRHDGTKKELKFNGRDEWVKPKREICSRELPQNVTDAISYKGYRLDDDEAEVVETPSGKWYEVEVRRLNEKPDLGWLIEGRRETHSLRQSPALREWLAAAPSRRNGHPRQLL